MIADTNNIVDFAFQSMSGAVGGDIILLALLVLFVVAGAMLIGKVKASSALMVGLGLVFVFSLVVGEIFFLFWLIIIAAIFILINGLRKQMMGQ